MATQQINDADILSAWAYTDYLKMGNLHFERVSQDRRIYYRLFIGGRSSGSLTDAKHARQTINHWREHGWLGPVNAQIVQEVR